MLIRAQEMARYVEDGILDAGLTGRDWVEENEAAGEYHRRPHLRQAEFRQSALGAGRAGSSPFQSVKDLEGKIIATELVGDDAALSGAHGVNAKVEFSWGATEVKPPVLPMPLSRSPKPAPRFAPTSSRSSTPCSNRTPN